MRVFVKMGSQVVLAPLVGFFGKAILRVVFWWDVGMGKVKVKVRKRRGKEGQVGAGEGLDKLGWWGGTTCVALMHKGGRTLANTHSPANTMATLAAGWVARPHQTVEPVLLSIGRTILR